MQQQPNKGRIPLLRRSFSISRAMSNTKTFVKSLFVALFLAGDATARLAKTTQKKLQLDETVATPTHLNPGMTCAKAANSNGVTFADNKCKIDWTSESAASTLLVPVTDIKCKTTQDDNPDGKVMFANNKCTFTVSHGDWVSCTAVTCDSDTTGAGEVEFADGTRKASWEG